MNKGSEGKKEQRETDAIQRAITVSLSRLEGLIEIKQSKLKGGLLGLVYAQSLINLNDFVSRCQGLIAKVTPTLNELKVLNEGLAKVVDELSSNNNLPEAMITLRSTMQEVNSMISAAETRQLIDTEALRKELNVGDLNLSDLDAAMKKAELPSPQKSTRSPAGQKEARKSGWSEPVNPRIKREVKPRPRSGWSAEDNEGSGLNPRVKQKAKPRPVSGWSGEDTEGSRLTQVGQAAARGSLKRDSTGPQSEPTPKRPASMRAIDWSKLEGKIKEVESTVKDNAEFKGKIKKLRGIAEKVKGEPASFPEINKMLDTLMGQYKKAVDQAQPKSSQSKK